MVQRTKISTREFNINIFPSRADVVKRTKAADREADCVTIDQLSFSEALYVLYAYLIIVTAPCCAELASRTFVFCSYTGDMRLYLCYFAVCNTSRK